MRQKVRLQKEMMNEQNTITKLTKQKSSRKITSERISDVPQNPGKLRQ